jgi:YfiH family protein
MNLHFKNKVGFLKFKKLEELDFIDHSFSTRLGGVSKDNFRSLNLGRKNKDSEANVNTNYEYFCQAIGVKKENMVFTKQSHSVNIKVVGKNGIENLSPEENFDALVTNQPGVVLVSAHADCCPIFMIDTVRKAVGLAHAGWKGTSAGIAIKLVKMMKKLYNSSDIDLVAAIGPAIGGCCFEIDSKTAAEIEKSLDLGNSNDIKKLIKIIKMDVNGEHIKTNKYKADLLGINKHQLISVGICPKSMFVSDICTRCSSDLLFSRRALGSDYGIMLATLSLR